MEGRRAELRSSRASPWANVLCDGRCNGWLISENITLPRCTARCEFAMRDVIGGSGGDGNMTWPENTESWLTSMQMHLVGECRTLTEATVSNVAEGMGGFLPCRR